MADKVLALPHLDTVDKQGANKFYGNTSKGIGAGFQQTSSSELTIFDIRYHFRSLTSAQNLF